MYEYTHREKWSMPLAEYIAHRLLAVCSRSHGVNFLKTLRQRFREFGIVDQAKSNAVNNLIVGIFKCQYI